jgi:acetyl esterase/lipase
MYAQRHARTLVRMHDARGVRQLPLLVSVWSAAGAAGLSSMASRSRLRTAVGCGHEMMSHGVLPTDVRTSETQLGGVACVEVRARDRSDAGTLLYLHGGAYAVGTAAETAALAADIARRAGAVAFSVDYRWPRSTPTRRPSSTPWPPTAHCSTPERTPGRWPSWASRPAAA